MASADRAVICVACALGASVACSSEGAGLARTTTDTHAQDMAAIEQLHQHDIAATLAGDMSAIAETWTDDIVLLVQGQEPHVGKQAILAARERQMAARPGFRPLSYVPEIKDTTIMPDGWAYQWVVVTGSYVATKGAEETRVRANVLRVLKKQADGSWKAAVGISIPRTERTFRAQEIR